MINIIIAAMLFIIVWGNTTYVGLDMTETVHFSNYRACLAWAEEKGKQWYGRCRLSVFQIPVRETLYRKNKLIEHVWWYQRSDYFEVERNEEAGIAFEKSVKDLLNGLESLISAEKGHSDNSSFKRPAE